MMRIANDTESTVDTSQAATQDEEAVISHIDSRKLTKKLNESMVGKMWQLKKKEFTCTPAAESEAVNSTLESQA